MYSKFFFFLFQKIELKILIYLSKKKKLLIIRQHELKYFLHHFGLLFRWTQHRCIVNCWQYTSDEKKIIIRERILWKPLSQWIQPINSPQFPFSPIHAGNLLGFNLHYIPTNIAPVRQRCHYRFHPILIPRRSLCVSPFNNWKLEEKKLRL